MSLNIGRKGRLYAKAEAAYNTSIALAAGNAVRHIDVGFSFDPFNRVNSSEKKQSPGTVNRFDRKKSAGFDLKSALLRPSGTLNTAPECAPFLLHGFGSVRNITLSTTVASGGTTAGATLTSVVGLAVGDPVLWLVAGVKYVRWITAIVGSAVTTAPLLPGAPANGSAVKAGICYNLTTDLSLSLTIAHYLAGFSRELNGVGIDKLSLMFDANEEPRISASGPAATQTTPAQTDPATFTTVGGNPPSGLVGDLYIGDAAYLFKKLSAEVTNGLKLRNEEYGVNAATEVYRGGRRNVEVSLEAFAETEATLYDFSEAGTVKPLMKQTGRTEGNIVALYAPLVDWKVPDTDDNDEATSWSFKGTCKESADAANDEIRLALF